MPPEVSEQAPVSTSDTLIKAIYAGILSRPATEQEVDQGRAILESAGPLSDVVQSVMNRKAFFEQLGEEKGGRIFREDKLMNDTSQNGEVELLIKNIVNAACPHRTLVDVGAHGLSGSNSYDLLRYFRWKGLLVEANPRLIDAIKKDFAGLDYDVETCAVSDFDGEATLCIGVSDGVSSLDEAAAAFWGPVTDHINVPVRRLASLLDQYGVPPDFDLLSLDIEHHDVRVLNDLITTSAYRPKWIIIEIPGGALFKDITKAGFSPAVQKAYTVADLTLANFILRRKPEIQPEA